MPHPDTERLRNQTETRTGRASPGAPVARAWAGTVQTTAAAVGQFMTVTPNTITGTESEGAAGTVTPSGSAQAVYLAGPRVPAAGAGVVVRWADWRWVAEKYSAATGGHTLTSCLCTVVPDQLYLSCPASYFGTAVVNEPITYGPAPAAVRARPSWPWLSRTTSSNWNFSFGNAPAGMPDPGWYSTNSFTFGGIAGHLWLYCSGGTTISFYQICWVADSEVASNTDPRNLISWQVNSNNTTPNRCSPFSMNTNSTADGSTLLP